MMTTTAPQLVVIIAAGTGSRLSSDAGPPKPLLPLNGRALMLRVLDRFHEAGISEAIIVTGHRAEEIESGILADHHPVALTFVRNPDFLKSNGLSVLAAKDVVGNRPFFLSMADHIFETRLITGLKTTPIPDHGLVLAVDRKLDQIYDEEDATKVQTVDGAIVAIGKTLADFDAVDTGLFACTPALFSHLDQISASRVDGDCSLSDGVHALSAAGRAITHDIGNGRWQDVDTPGAAENASIRF